MYDDLPGTTQEMYGDFPLAFCSHLITQTPFKGYSTAFKAIRGLFKVCFFFFHFFIFFYFFRPTLRNYWTIGQNALRWTLP